MATSLWAQIEAAYERDQQDPGRRAVERTDVPLAYENITPLWLTAVLCSDVPGAEVISFELGPRDDGSSNRRRIGVEYNDVGRQAGLPQKIFAKASQLLSNRLTLGISGVGPAEVSFYKHVRPKLDVEAPVCYHAALDPESYRLIILLQDLSDAVAEFTSHTTDMTLERAQSQLRNLAKVHGPYWGKGDIAEGDLRHFRSLPDLVESLVEHLQFDIGCEEGFRAAERVIPPALYARADEIWPKTMEGVALHDREPKTLLHGDVHLKNWYVLRNGEMGVGDWQCTNRGLWAFDIAYAMSTALTPENRRAWEQDLLRYYLEQLHATGGPAIGFDEAWLAYRRQLLPPLAWWTITLRRPLPGSPEIQPEDTTLEFIRRLSIAIDDHGSLDLI
jgi:hypothetical protein